jgi:RNA polymerase sigma factor (sigma-70 family)
MPTVMPDHRLATDAELARLLRLSDGKDQEIIAVIAERYSDRLLRAISRSLSSALRRKYDPTEILQSVLKSFIRWVSRGELHTPDADCFRRLLFRFAKHKVLHKARYERAAKRAVSRTQTVCEELPTRATDEDQFEFRELLHHLWERLDAQGRRVLELHLQGKSQGEIAEAMSCSRATVCRALQRIEADVSDLAAGVEQEQHL